jgi:hypothetical protein
MNEPYKFLAIKSVIDHCADEFNICILNDDSFTKVLPGWQIDMTNIADPIRGKLRRMGLVKILREHGGLIVPDSFVCSKSLFPLISDGNTLGEGVVCGNIPSPALFLGAPAQDETIKSYATSLEHTISNDYTAESIFRDEDSLSNNIPDVQLGLIDTSGRAVTLDRLMGSTFVDISYNAYGVYIPDEILTLSTKYQWFARLSVEQVLNSNTFAGKRFLLANDIAIPRYGAPTAP